MSSDSSSLLHNRESFQGRLRSATCVNAKVFVTSLTIVGFLVIASFFVAGRAKTKYENEPSSSNVQNTLVMLPQQVNSSLLVSTIKEASLEYTGPSETIKFFPGLDFDTFQAEKIQSIEINNFIINATSISISLRQFPNLKTLVLNNVDLLEEFIRIPIPTLTKFTLHERILGRNKTISDYNNMHKVRSSLFWDQNESSFAMSEFALGHVEISLRVEGTTVLSSSPGEMVLNVPFAEEILKAVPLNFNLTEVTLIDCNITEKIPQFKSLTYVNLRNVGFVNGSFSSALREMKKLTHLVASLPGDTIDLQDLSPTLQVLSTMSMKMNTSNGFVSTVSSLALEGSSMDSTFVQNFNSTFANLKEMALFEFQNGQQMQLVSKALSTKVSWLLVENYMLLMLSNGTQPELNSYLNKLKIKNGTNFLLQTPEMGEERIGVSLTDEQIDFYKFQFQGWYKFKTWDAFEI